MPSLIPPEMGAKYNIRFDNQKLNQIKGGPVEKRSCTDIICLVIFLIITLTYVIFTAYFLANGGSSLNGLTKQESVKNSSASFGATFSKVVGIIIGMIALSIVFSIVFVFLCAKFPKCVVYTAIVVTFLVYLALIVLGFIMKIWALAIVFIVVALLNACMLYCWRHKIKIGIVLLGVSGSFMTQKPTIVLIGVISLVLNVVFQIVFVLGWISSYSQTLPQNNSSEDSRDKFTGMMYGYFFMTIYLGYFLYYLMVFALSTIVAYWYYLQQKSVLYGYKVSFKHIGSFAFASAVITVITILKRASQQQYNEGNGVIKFLWCIIACIMSCIQGFVQVLNHNAVIVMSVTAENYIDSAKSAIALIFSNFGLFFIVDFITDFIQFYSLIFCVLIPSLIGGGLIWQSQKVQNTAVIGGIIIFLLSWIISSIILGILYEVLSSIFILYCLDRKLRSQGVTVGNIPKQIKDLFIQAGNREGSFDIVHSQKPSPGTQINLKHDKNKPDIDRNPYAYKDSFNQVQYKNKPQNNVNKNYSSYARSTHPIQDDIYGKNQANPSPQHNNQQKLHPFYQQQSQFQPPKY